MKPCKAAPGRISRRSWNTKHVRKKKSKDEKDGKAKDKWTVVRFKSDRDKVTGKHDEVLGYLVQGKERLRLEAKPGQAHTLVAVAGKLEKEGLVEYKKLANEVKKGSRSRSSRNSCTMTIELERHEDFFVNLEKLDKRVSESEAALTPIPRELPYNGQEAKKCFRPSDSSAVQGVFDQWFKGQEDSPDKPKNSLNWIDKSRSPVWCNTIFNAEFASYHFDENHVDTCTALHVYSKLLRDTLLEQQQWLGLSPKQYDAMRNIHTAMVASIPMFNRCKTFDRDENQHSLAALIHEVSKILGKLEPGDVCIIPAQVELSRLPMIIELEGPKKARVTVVNSGYSAYHPKVVSVPNKIQQYTAVSVKDVPMEHLEDEAFWTFVLDNSGVPEQVFYTHFLGWLHQGIPYYTAISATPDEQSPRTPSCKSGPCIWKALHHTLDYLAQREGLQKETRKLFKFNMRHQLLKWVVNDLHVTKIMTISGRKLIRIAGECVAKTAVQTPYLKDSSRHLTAVKQTLDKIDDRIALMQCESNITEPPTKLDLTNGYEKLSQAAVSPCFERLRRLEDVDGLAGALIPQPKFVPANFLLIPDRVSNRFKAVDALRDADMLCTRVMVQSRVIKNSNFLIISLLENLFIHVLPMPRFGDKDCAWQQPMMYAQQLDIVLLLQRLVEHWAAACFSTLATREFDIIRITVTGAMSVIADAVLRQQATDRPSQLSAHLAGFKGRLPPFAPTPGMFAEQSETIEVIAPEVNIVKTQILDYFEALMAVSPPERHIFKWEITCKSDMGSARLCFQMADYQAFPLEAPMNYLSQNTDPHYLITKNCPEFKAYRDIIFYFKYFMNTEAGGFPHLSSYTQHAAQLSWQFLCGVGYHVEAFDRMLSCKARTHRWPSYAVASRFTLPNEVTNEEDVLHIKTLPTFADTIGQKDSELLLSYLTTPYIRIPLVVNFFATEDRVSLLRKDVMQNILDSVLFEPGRFQTVAFTDVAPTTVPSDNDELLSTPYGLLINELQHSPSTVIDPLLNLLNLAIELDSGTVFNETAVDIMCYLVRMLSRVYNYLSFLLKYAARRHKSFNTPLRGLNVLPTSLRAVANFHHTFQDRLHNELQPMLEKWIEEARSSIMKKEGDTKAVETKELDRITQLICKLQAHVLMLHRNTEKVDASSAGTLIGSFVYLSARHTWNQKLIPIPETELYEIIHLQRRALVEYLCTSGPSAMSFVLDGVVRSTTDHGGREPTAGCRIRTWSYVGGPSNIGRFTIQANEAFPSLSDDLHNDLKRSFITKPLNEEVRFTADGYQTDEVNLQTFQLTFRTSHLKALPEQMCENDDVRTVFYEEEDRLSVFQCASVENAQHREWVRLVGQDHDIQHWHTTDPRMFLAENDRMYPEFLKDSEKWIEEIFEPVRRNNLERPPWRPPILIYLPERTITENETTAFLEAIDSETGGVVSEVYVFKAHKAVHIYEPTWFGRRRYRSLVYTSDARSSLLALQPSPQNRDTKWAPWARHEAGLVLYKGGQENDCIILRHATATSKVPGQKYYGIEGNLSGGIEQFIPQRLLHGLIPSCLLDSYLFWQDTQDNLRGYPLKNEDPDGQQPQDIIFVQLRDVNYKPMKASFPHTVARIVRYSHWSLCPRTQDPKKTPVEHPEGAITELPELDLELALTRTSTTEMDEMLPEQSSSQHAQEENMVLLDLLHAAEGTPLHSLARLLMHIEDLSHVLAWTKSDYRDGDQLEITRVQLPRLKLNFTAKVDISGEMRLYSLDHAHLFVSNHRNPLTLKLLQGMPHALLMQDLHGQMSVLFPSFNVKRPCINDNPFTTDIVILRNDLDWLKNCDTRYYLYPVHVSFSFLFTPTLASSLYLLLHKMNYRDYQEAFRLSGAIGTDRELTAEENQIFDKIGEIEDTHPDAHACRCKISLLTVDSPLEFEWYVPREAAKYLLKKSKVSAACRLNDMEEKLLMWISHATEEKMKIIEAQKAKDKHAFELVSDAVLEKLDSILEGTTNKVRRIKTFIREVKEKINNQLDLKCGRDEILRLVDMYNDIVSVDPLEPHFQCLLFNYRSYLSAVVCEWDECEVQLPPLGKDEYWNFKSDPAAMKSLPPARFLNVQHSHENLVTLNGVLNKMCFLTDSWKRRNDNPAQRDEYDNCVMLTGTDGNNQSFLWYYSLLRGKTRFKIGKGKASPWCVFWMMLPFHKLTKEVKKSFDTGDIVMNNFLVACSYAIKNNPWILPRLPVWDPEKRKHKYTSEWETTVPYWDNFIRQFFKVLSESDLAEPSDPTIYDTLKPAPEYLKVVPPLLERESTLTPLSSTMVLPQLSDTGCSERCLQPELIKGLPARQQKLLVFGKDDLDAYVDRPLQVVGLEKYLEFVTREEIGLEQVPSELPFDLTKHPTSHTVVSVSMVKRLTTDMEEFAKGANESKMPALIGLHPNNLRDILANNKVAEVRKITTNLETLLADLTTLRDAGVAYMDTVMPLLVKLGNHVPESVNSSCAGVSFMLRRYCNQEVSIWLEYMLGGLVSSNLKHDLKKLNPFLTDESTNTIEQLVTASVLVACRVGHANKARDDIQGLVDVLKSIGSRELKKDALVAHLLQKADAVAMCLSTQRRFIKSGEAGHVFDPRFLMFEFILNIVLREEQIVMVNDFMNSLRKPGGSLVKQMIMGAGKTTVVGPLVALMAADGETLIMQVVPAALLDFSRGVLRKTFSCIIRKQIFSFECDRTGEVDTEVYDKFTRAQRTCGIVVTTPSSVKSIYLKFIEGLHKMEDTTLKPPPPEEEKEVRILAKMLQQWRSAVLVMDEVDLLLHPLKSELNFPIGTKYDLDLVPVRWKLCIHLLDAVYYNKLNRMTVPFKDSSKAREILSQLCCVLDKGYTNRALQPLPHVVLLNLKFYETEMKPLMARWLWLWLHSQHLTALNEEEVVSFLMHRHDGLVSLIQERQMLPYHVKMLNLGHDWLNSYLPHVLQKINRVSFGILEKREIKKVLQDQPLTPQTRIKLAIPFVGKDQPSHSSEFAHPDIVIGLSVLAYRYQGLRMQDFEAVLKEIQATVEKEPGKYAQRKTNVLYEKWVEAAGGKIIERFNYVKKTKGNVEEDITLQPSESYSAMDGEEKPEVVPLRLLKQSNREEVTKLYQLLKRTPEVIHWYLDNIVFPDCMRHQATKMSASGQELGGTMIFGRRIGFSGTPSDLLPDELGKCDYERCTDGRLIHTLTSPETVSYRILDSGWTVRSALNLICNANPPFHALIDTGALITGMSNFEVAKYLLKHGLPTMEGCVFVDQHNRQMILVRATGRVLKLEECGIPPLKRFMFYDQVHTTGMDVAHTPNAQAVLTLGKDMTFRDFSQGAYRMRGIAKGQTIHLLIIPEVYDLISREVKACGGKSLAAPNPHSTEDTSKVLVDCVTWLMANSMKMERIQFNQLCVQIMANVYRKAAFANLLQNHKMITLKHSVRPTTQVRNALSVFREPVSFCVPEVVPQSKMFSAALQEMTDKHEEFLKGKEAIEVTTRIQEKVRQEDEVNRPNHDVQMVQEQEDEKEQEEEKEVEREVEIERFIDLAYSRDDEAPQPWPVESLANTKCVYHPAIGAEQTDSQLFYMLQKFRLYKRRPLDFPDTLLLSNNFFNPSWAGHRRIKNVIMVLEWVHDATQLKEKASPSRDYGEYLDGQLGDSAHEQIRRTLRLLEKDGKLDATAMSDLMKIALGHGVSGQMLSAVMTSPELSTAETVDILKGNLLRGEQSGRNFVAVSLAEAETIRRIIHVKGNAGLPFLGSSSATHVALRHVPASNRVIDASKGFPFPEYDYQQNKANVCFRFFDCEMQYTDSAQNLLLRSMHCSPAKQRMVFFTQVMGCRRRGVQRWEATPLSQVFRLSSAFTLLRQKAIGVMMRRKVQERNMLLGDAFKAFNSSGTGVLSPAEVWGALTWLGFETSAEEVLQFVQTADTIGEGNVNYPDFLQILTGERETEEDLHTADDAGKTLPQVKPRGEAELRKLHAELSAIAQNEEAIALKEQEEEDKEAAKLIEEQEDTIFALSGKVPNPCMDGNTLKFDFSQSALPRHVVAYGRARTCREKPVVHLNSLSVSGLNSPLCDRQDITPMKEKKDKEAILGWDIGEESYLKLPLRLIDKEALGVQVIDDGLDSEAESWAHTYTESESEDPLHEDTYTSQSMESPTYDSEDDESTFYEESKTVVWKVGNAAIRVFTVRHEGRQFLGYTVNWEPRPPITKIALLRDPNEMYFPEQCRGVLLPPDDTDATKVLHNIRNLCTQTNTPHDIPPEINIHPPKKGYRDWSITFDMRFPTRRTFTEVCLARVDPKCIFVVSSDGVVKCDEEISDCDEVSDISVMAEDDFGLTDPFGGLGGFVGFNGFRKFVMSSDTLSDDDMFGFGVGKKEEESEEVKEILAELSKMDADKMLAEMLADQKKKKEEKSGDSDASSDEEEEKHSEQSGTSVESDVVAPMTVGRVPIDDGEWHVVTLKISEPSPEDVEERSSVCAELPDDGRKLGDGWLAKHKTHGLCTVHPTPEGAYDISIVATQEEVNAVPREELHYAKRPLEKDEIVYAKKKNGYSQGIIEAINKDGTYSVAFDDGAFNHSMKHDHIDSAIEYSYKTGRLQDGACVWVKPDVRKPAYGWHGVKHGDIGEVECVRDTMVIVNFKNNDSWEAEMDELEIPPEDVLRKHNAKPHDPDEVQRPVCLRAFIDGRQVEVDGQPKARYTRLTLENGLQLFGGDNIGALKMLGGVVKWVNIDVCAKEDTTILEEHRAYLESYQWMCNHCHKENQRTSTTCEACTHARYTVPKESGTRVAGVDTDAEDEAEAIAQRRQVVGAMPRSQLALEARAKAKRRGRKFVKWVLQRDDPRYKRKSEQRNKQGLKDKHKALKVITKKLGELTEQYENQIQPLYHQIERLELQAHQQKTHEALNQQIEDLRHRIHMLEYEKEMQEIPWKEKEVFLNMKYLPLRYPDELELKEEHTELKTELVKLKQAKMKCERDMKVAPLESQIRKLSDKRNKKQGGNYRRIDQQINQTQAKVNRMNFQHDRDMEKFEKLESRLFKEMDQMRRENRLARIERKKKEREDFDSDTEETSVSEEVEEYEEETSCDGMTSEDDGVWGRKKKRRYKESETETTSDSDSTSATSDTTAESDFTDDEEDEETEEEEEEEEAPRGKMKRQVTTTTEGTGEEDEVAEEDCEEEEDEEEEGSEMEEEDSEPPAKPRSKRVVNKAKGGKRRNLYKRKNVVKIISKSSGR